ncbi:MAG: DISARM system SNF2-like helicase DrmD [Bacillota bacterium]
MSLILPQAGQTVMVRSRLGRVRDVRVHSHPLTGGNLHLVEVEYLDDRRFPESDTIIWEREVGANIATRIRLPRLDAGQPDPPSRYQAFVNAIRWSAVNRLSDPRKEEGPAQPLLSPWYGAVQVEDYQLYPVLKALEMPRISLLLADDVGLGKTVEAGLILSELIARRRARRVLVICPATIQIQWQEELRSKFNLDFRRMDRSMVEMALREYGADANPWSTFPHLITSMDYLRQPAVLEQFKAATTGMYRGDSGILPWDLLIVDEAHNFTPNRFHDDSQRTQMLREISAHFEHRIFLTATPHNGFTVSFTGLLELLDPVRFQQKAELSTGDQKQIRAVMVRRLKSELNARSVRPRFAKRRVKALQVDLTPEEVALFEALKAYRDQADVVLSESRAERQMGRFLFSLFTKRLLSSTYAFARTWWSHVDGFGLGDGDLATAKAAADRAEVVVEDDEEKATREQDVARQGAAWLRTYQTKLRTYVDNLSKAVEAAGWPRDRAMADEITGKMQPPDGRWAGLLSCLKQHLYQGDSLRHDERLIIFTEYRDTQRYLLWRLRTQLQLSEPEVLPLFGGASLELREAVKEQFNSPESPLRLLVATDAASEGLNLQTSCRYVLHQEVPWNPMRMEQRNGRVDRHGQARDVTIFHFSSDSNADLNFLAYVAGKVDQVRDDLGSVGQVFDSAIQAHFAGQAVGQAHLEKQLAVAREESEERTDLTHRDSGEEAQIRHQLADLHLQERQMGFSPGTLAQLFREAVTLSGGEVQEAGEPDVLRLTVPPPAWKKLLEESFRGPSGQAATHLPKLAFDHRLFLEVVEGREIFRYRPDTVLLRLGHPVMRRALAILRRHLWEPGKIQRWTVVGQPNQPYEAVMTVTALVTATNELREPINEEVLTLPLVVEGDYITPMDETLWAELSRDRTYPLPLADISFWGDRMAEYWPDFQKQIDRLLEKRRNAEEKRIADWLTRWREKEATREEKAFAARLKELEAGRDVKAVEALQKKLVKAQKRAQQMLFDPEEQAIRQAEVARLQRELDDANFELQSSHVEALRHRLSRDRERVITQVIPRRFQLAHFDLHPVAVELRVRTH